MKTDFLNMHKKCKKYYISITQKNKDNWKTWVEWNSNVNMVKITKAKIAKKNYMKIPQNMIRAHRGLPKSNSIIFSMIFPGYLEFFQGCLVAMISTIIWLKCFPKPSRVLMYINLYTTNILNKFCIKTLWCV